MKPGARILDPSSARHP